MLPTFLRSKRLCDNPPPSNGGSYCVGDAKRHRVCDTGLRCSTAFLRKDIDRQCGKGISVRMRAIRNPRNTCQMQCVKVMDFFQRNIKLGFKGVFKNLHDTYLLGLESRVEKLPLCALVNFFRSKIK